MLHLTLSRLLCLLVRRIGRIQKVTSRGGLGANMETVRSKLMVISFSARGAHVLMYVFTETCCKYLSRSIDTLPAND